MELLWGGAAFDVLLSDAIAQQNLLPAACVPLRVDGAGVGEFCMDFCAEAEKDPGEGEYQALSGRG